MDTLTHSLSGALVGRVLSKKAKIIAPAGFIATGALAATFPDFDFILRAFGHEFYMSNHRGITHSFFLMPFWSALIAFVMATFFIKTKNKEKWFLNPTQEFNKKLIFKDLYFVSLLSMLAHVLGDLVTSFGTMILWPIKTRFEFGSVFIIDLFFTGIIVLGLLLSWKFGKDRTQKSNIALISTLCLLTYIGFTQYMKVEAKNEMIKRVVSHHPEYSDSKKIIYDAQPQMFLPTNWVGIAYDIEKEVYFYSPMQFTGEVYERFDEIKKWGDGNVDKAKVAFIHPTFEMQKWFMKHPYVVSNDGECIVFRDMRYDSPYRGKNPFEYSICDKK